MRIRRGTYAQHDHIVDWLNEGTLHPMEQSAFAHWAGMRNLTAIVDRAEAGIVPRFVAVDAIAEHNASCGTSITYEEVAGRYAHNFIFSAEAEWVIYTDVQGLEHLVKGENDDPAEAMDSAPPTCAWMIIWCPAEQEIVVYRSPHVQNRCMYDPNDDDHVHAAGMLRGSFHSYTIPPDVEGSILQEEMAARARYTNLANRA